MFPLLDNLPVEEQIAHAENQINYNLVLIEEYTTQLLCCESSKRARQLNAKIKKYEDRNSLLRELIAEQKEAVA